MIKPAAYILISALGVFSGGVLVSRRVNQKKESVAAQNIIGEWEAENLNDDGGPNDDGKALSFKVILENNRNEITALAEADHGLCIYMKAGKKKYLLDTGTGDVLARNAAKLNVDLSGIDAVFISHAHYDHSGGLRSFLEANEKAKVYLKKEALSDKHIGKVAGIIQRDASFDHEVAEDYPERFNTVDSLLEIDKNIFIIPHIEQIHPLPETNKNLYKKKNRTGISERDDFDHEMLLVVRDRFEDVYDDEAGVGIQLAAGDTDKDVNRDQGGLIVYSGCCHSGVLNVIDTVKKIFPGEKIKAIIGGFHLMNMVFMKLGESEEKVISLGESMAESEVEKFYTGHCTGIEAYRILEKVLESRIEYIYTGKSFKI